MGEGGKEISVDPILYSVIQNSVTAGVSEGVKNALTEMKNRIEE